MNAYSGYLKPHEEPIRWAIALGISPKDVATWLYVGLGVRSPNENLNGLCQETTIRSFSGLIRHMVRDIKREPEQIFNYVIKRPIQ